MRRQLISYKAGHKLYKRQAGKSFHRERCAYKPFPWGFLSFPRRRESPDDSYAFPWEVPPARNDGV